MWSGRCSVHIRCVTASSRCKTAGDARRDFTCIPGAWNKQGNISASKEVILGTAVVALAYMPLS